MPRYDFGKFPKIEHQREWANSLHAVRSRLNDWEQKFLDNMMVQLSLTTKPLSEEQVYKLEQLYAKYTD